MTTLAESATYTAGVYQLETTDPVDAGTGGSGVANQQAKDLANRTKYLKLHVDNLESGATVPTGIAVLNSPAFTGSPTVPTAAAGDNSTLIANTAFVKLVTQGILTKSVAGSSNVTLSADEAGRGVLLFTGALTGNINVILPVGGKWVVDNQTSGAFSLTCKTASGTGYAVPQGVSVLLFADGTNIVNAGYNQVTSVAGKTGVVTLAVADVSGAAPLASPSLTGTPVAPTASTGDNSTQLATTAFVKAQAYATLASPTLTGSPAAPTPGGSDNSTAIATTAFVKNQAYATLASPALTGTPTAPTPASTDSSTKIATTAFVQANVVDRMATRFFEWLAGQAGPWSANSVANSWGYTSDGSLACIGDVANAAAGSACIRTPVTDASGVALPNGLGSTSSGQYVAPYLASKNPTFKALLHDSTGGSATRKIGLMDSPPGGGGADPTNGIYFRFTITGGVNITLVCRSGGVESTVDSGIAVSTGTCQELSFVVTGGNSVQGYINGVAFGAPITTHIPTAALGIALTSGTTVQAGIFLAGAQAYQSL